MRIQIATLLIYAVCCCGCSNMLYTGQQQSTVYRADEGHLPEALRRDIATVDVVLDTTKPRLRIGGDYGQELMTVGEGAGDGLVKGAGVAGLTAAHDPRAALVLPFILPAAMVAGGIVGAAAAKIELELAEFREGLTSELAADNHRDHPGSSLVHSLRQRLESSSDYLGGEDQLDTQLTVSIPEVSIETYGKEAVVTTTARITLQTSGDADELYTRNFYYAERDKLKKWTDNDNAQWNAYAERAKHALGETIHADLFEIVYLRHVLRPVATESYTGGWSGTATASDPTVAWELFLLGGDPYGSTVERADVRFDLRIYDADVLIYQAAGLTEPQHTISTSLPACRALHWTVRPIYQMDGRSRAGEWMHFVSNFEKVWRSTPVRGQPMAPEHYRYFARLKTRCRS